MAREIELKARINNPGEITEKLAQAVFRWEFEKEDAYWRPDEPYETPGTPAYGVRVRKEKTAGRNGELNQTVYVTWKEKEVRNGVEFNNEKEFEVSPAPVFEEFLAQLGFRVKMTKHKKGKAYLWNGINTEVTEVKGLGWFVELEIILNGNDEAREREAREKLLDSLDLLGINRDTIESRSYSALLAERSI